MCCVALSATFLSTANERPSERTNHLPTCFFSSCGYVSVSLNRMRRVRTTGVGQSQRARVQHADTLQHATGAHGALRLCWYGRRCKGAYTVESRVLYRTLSCSPQGPYRVLCRVPERSQWVLPTSTPVCTQREPTMGVQGTAHRSTAASNPTHRRQTWPC
jgi:hypothetical protein